MYFSREKKLNLKQPKLSKSYLNNDKNISKLKAKLFSKNNKIHDTYYLRISQSLVQIRRYLLDTCLLAGLPNPRPEDSRLVKELWRCWAPFPFLRKISHSWQILPKPLFFQNLFGNPWTMPHFAAENISNFEKKKLILVC